MVALLANVRKVNTILTIGSKRLEEDLKDMLKDERSSLSEQIRIVGFNKPASLPERDELWTLQEREADVKEYFFGDAKMVLSPSTQLVDFESLTIYKIPQGEYLIRPPPPLLPFLLCSVKMHGFLLSELAGSDDVGAIYPADHSLERVEPSAEMTHWTLAIMQASVKDTPEVIRSSPVLGFVYVADLDAERSKVKLLAPLPERLGDRPLIWGQWPEPHVNLLG